MHPDPADGRATMTRVTEPPSPSPHPPHPPSTEAPPDQQWWRDAVIYQIYPRSFADSDGDGVGDLPGIVDHLGALVELGVDAVWLNPFYRSPQVDAGYDVEDHCDVDPCFGTLLDVDVLLERAHELGLRVIVDLVPNHTSDRHRWFREALASPVGSTARRRYLFRPGAGADGSDPPNDWHSVFGGPAWTYVPSPTDSDDETAAGEWYLHLFAPEQPDLDWTNPEVRDEFESILRFWLDRGVDGFRIDVAHGLAKDPEMPDLAGRFATGGLAETGHPHWDQDEVHDVYRSWRRVIDEYPGDRVFVAEAYLADPGRLAQYVREDELHTAFNFRFLMADWDADQLRHAIVDTLETHDAVGAPATWVLSNHDVQRVVTRYGDGELGERRARAAALLMLSLPGSAYVYQGEELGLPEVLDLPDDLRQDPTFERTRGAEPGRDGCRVPLPWRRSEPAFGFSPSGATWLPQPATWSSFSRDVQTDDPVSFLSLYRVAIAHRRDDIGRDPGLNWLDLGPQVLAFERAGGRVVCVTNLGAEVVEVPSVGRVLLASDGPVDAAHEVRGRALVAADTTTWFLRD
jgi:alpha-glucosidase